MNIGSAINLARKNLGFSKKELAERVRLSPSAITRIENDERGLPLKTAQEIAQALGLRLSQLVIIAESILEPENEIKMLQSKLLLSVQPILSQENPTTSPGSKQSSPKRSRPKPSGKELRRAA